MDSPETWRWIWLAAAMAFTVGEMATAGSFFLLPFGLGALVASILAFVGVDVGWTWVAFIGVSGIGLAALYPLRKRLDRGEPQDGIGARRLLGQAAAVLEVIPGGPAETGLVRVGREEWRAESLDGQPIAAGTLVKVVEVRGTRVVVYPQPALGTENPAAPGEEKGV
jgi:membrane protein implicated in regulation of membrane protease activity